MTRAGLDRLVAIVDRATDPSRAPLPRSEVEQLLAQSRAPLPPSDLFSGLVPDSVSGALPLTDGREGQPVIVSTVGADLSA